MKNILLALLTLVSLSCAQNIYATFDVAAVKSANLAFTASGIVQKVNVDIGSVVSKNQTLALLDNSDIEAMLQKTQIVLKFASRELKRQKKIKKLHLIEESAARIADVTYKMRDIKEIRLEEYLDGTKMLRLPDDSRDSGKETPRPHSNTHPRGWP